MLHGIAVRLVFEQRLQLVDADLALVGQAAYLVEGALRLLRGRAGRLHAGDALGQLPLEAIGRREDEAVAHQHHELCFDVDRFVVLLDRHVVACVPLPFGQDAVLLERLDHVGLHRLAVGLDRGAVVEQPALGRFLLPFVGVAVAVEDDLLVLLEQLHQQLLDGGLELLAVLQPLFELGGAVVERLGDGDVEGDARQRDALVRRDRAELELVAGEGERAGAVAVAGIARQLRQHADADIEDAAALGRLGAAGLFDLLEDVGELVAEEDRDDRRRRFVGAEPMVVAGAGDAEAQQPLELVDRAETAAQNTRNWMLSCGVSPGLSRLLPSSSLMLQFRCLPEPLTPANGFSCIRQASPYFGAIRRSISIVIIWWSVATLAFSKIGATSILPGRDFVVAGLDRHADA